MEYYKKLDVDGNIEFLYKFSKKDRTIEYYINGEAVKYSFNIPLPEGVVKISKLCFYSSLNYSRMISLSKVIKNTSTKTDTVKVEKTLMKIQYDFFLGTKIFISGYSSLDEESFISFVQNGISGLKVKDERGNIKALLNQNLISQGSFVFSKVSTIDFKKLRNKL